MGRRWLGLFAPTSLIYGLKMIAIFAFLYDTTADLAGRNVTFYVDNNHALEALVSNAAGPPAIAAMPQLIWFRIAALNMAVWFGRTHRSKI